MDCSPPSASVHGDSPGRNTRVSCHALLQGIFLTQGSNPGLLHCRQILYQVSYQGSPRILEWIAYPFSKGSSRPRNRTGASCVSRQILHHLSYQGSPNKLRTGPAGDKIGSQWKFAVWLRELKLGLCNNLDGWKEWEVGGEIQEEGNICTSMVNSC